MLFSFWLRVKQNGGQQNKLQKWTATQKNKFSSRGN